MRGMGEIGQFGSIQRLKMTIRSFVPQKPLHAIWSVAWKMKVREEMVFVLATF